VSSRFGVFYVVALAVTCVGLIGTLLPRAHGNTFNDMPVRKVNEPITAGNNVLDPYSSWNLLGSRSDRQQRQIFDRDQTPFWRDF